MKLVRRIRRVAGTAATALEMAGRLALRRERDLVWCAATLQGIALRLLRIHGIAILEQGVRPKATALLVSNHVNYLDPLVLMALHPALPIAKEEVRRWPVIGGLCERAGVQFVARARTASGAATLRAIARALLAGVSILNFPEGTTSEGRGVLPLKPGCFGAARIAQVPVVPVAIAWESPELSWIGDDSFVPHYLEVAARERIAVRVSWGEPILPSRSAGDLDLSRRAHEFLARSLEEIRHAAAECA